MVATTLTLGDALVVLLLVILGHAVSGAVAFGLGYYYLSDIVQELVMPAQPQGAQGATLPEEDDDFSAATELSEQINTSGDEFPDPVTGEGNSSSEFWEDDNE